MRNGNASNASSSQRSASFFRMLMASIMGVRGGWVNGSEPALTVSPDRAALRMYGKTSHAPNAASFPLKPGLVLSHSKTLMLGFGTLSLLLMRASAKPQNASL